MYSYENILQMLSQHCKSQLEMWIPGQENRILLKAFHIIGKKHVLADYFGICDRDRVVQLSGVKAASFMVSINSGYLPYKR